MPHFPLVQHRRGSTRQSNSLRISASASEIAEEINEHAHNGHYSSPSLHIFYPEEYLTSLFLFSPLNASPHLREQATHMTVSATPRARRPPRFVISFGTKRNIPPFTSLSAPLSASDSLKISSQILRTRLVLRQRRGECGHARQVPATAKPPANLTARKLSPSNLSHYLQILQLSLKNLFLSQTNPIQSTSPRRPSRGWTSPSQNSKWPASSPPRVPKRIKATCVTIPPPLIYFSSTEESLTQTQPRYPPLPRSVSIGQVPFCKVSLFQLF